MAPMNYLEGMPNAKSYWLDIAIIGACRQICGRKFIPKINSVRVGMVGRADAGFSRKVWKFKLGPAGAAAAVIGQVERQNKHQKEQHNTLHFGLRLLPSLQYILMNFYRRILQPMSRKLSTIDGEHKVIIGRPRPVSPEGPLRFSF